MEVQKEKVKSEVTAIHASKKEVQVEVPAEEAEREFERVIGQYALRAKVDGFRVGKAPKDLVKRMFYAEIKNSVIDALMPRALDESLKAHSIEPVVSPVVEDLNFEEGKPLRFRASVEVWPEFELPEYGKTRIEERTASVEEAEIEQSMEELRQKSAEYTPIEGRGVMPGDYVVVEMKGKDLTTKRYLPTEKVVILAGHSENEKVLEEHLAGLKPEESRTFVYSYAKDDPNKKLAGKKIEYEMKVLSIKEKRVPELDDDFAKDMGEFGNLEELKAKIKEELLARKKSVLRREMADEIVAVLADQLTGTLPESVIEKEYVSLLRNLLSALPEKSDMTPDKVESLKSAAKKEAEKAVRNHLVLRKVVEKEKIEVTQEEVEEEIKAVAKSNKVPLARVRESLNEEGRMAQLQNRLLFKKAVDFLLEKAIIN